MTEVKSAGSLPTWKIQSFMKYERWTSDTQSRMRNITSREYTSDEARQRDIDYFNANIRWENTSTDTMTYYVVAPSFTEAIETLEVRLRGVYADRDTVQNWRFIPVSCVPVKGQYGQLETIFPKPKESERNPMDLDILINKLRTILDDITWGGLGLDDAHLQLNDTIDAFAAGEGDFKSE